MRVGTGAHAELLSAERKWERAVLYTSNACVKLQGALSLSLKHKSCISRVPLLRVSTRLQQTRINATQHHVIFQTCFSVWQEHMRLRKHNLKGQLSASVQYISTEALPHWVRSGFALVASLFLERCFIGASFIACFIATSGIGAGTKAADMRTYLWRALVHTNRTNALAFRAALCFFVQIASTLNTHSSSRVRLRCSWNSCSRSPWKIQSQCLKL